MIRQDQAMVELEEEADESHDMEVRTSERGFCCNRAWAEVQ